uniref:Btz domain-containing protein n=1 Tax=Strongyloides papillosus TaxID=174720 RepID=A0A0N5B457_STREA
MLRGRSPSRMFPNGNHRGRLPSNQGSPKGLQSRSRSNSRRRSRSREHRQHMDMNFKLKMHGHGLAQNPYDVKRF